MAPFRVPPEGGTQIGENGVEHKRTESGRGDGEGEGGQLAAEGSSGGAGAKLSASQTGVGAISGRGSESAPARQLRTAVESCVPGGVSQRGARPGAGALRGFRAHAGQPAPGER